MSKEEPPLKFLACGEKKRKKEKKKTSAQCASGWGHIFNHIKS
jgi:hypothetical protein